MAAEAEAKQANKVYLKDIPKVVSESDLRFALTDAHGPVQQLLVYERAEWDRYFAFAVFSCRVDAEALVQKGSLDVKGHTIKAYRAKSRDEMARERARHQQAPSRQPPPLSRTSRWRQDQSPRRWSRGRSLSPLHLGEPASRRRDSPPAYHHRRRSRSRSRSRSPLPRQGRQESRPDDGYSIYHAAPIAYPDATASAWANHFAAAAAAATAAPAVSIPAPVSVPVPMLPFSAFGSPMATCFAAHSAFPQPSFAPAAQSSLTPATLQALLDALKLPSSSSS